MYYISFFVEIATSVSRFLQLLHTFWLHDLLLNMMLYCYIWFFAATRTLLLTGYIIIGVMRVCLCEFVCKWLYARVCVRVCVCVWIMCECVCVCVELNNICVCVCVSYIPASHPPPPPSPSLSLSILARHFYRAFLTNTPIYQSIYLPPPVSIYPVYLFFYLQSIISIYLLIFQTFI